jgi:two-component system response regulator QseB
VLGIRLCLGNLVLDTTSRQVSVNAANVAMSVREVALLELLMRRQGAVVPRDLLEQGLYSFDSQLGSNAMEVLVHRLRRKLTDAEATACIHTVRGVGYMLADAG